MPTIARTSKTAKERHERLLSKGFFAPEMPSCFYSDTFGLQRGAILREFNKIPNLKPKPAFHSFKAELAGFNFPRFGREDRRHSYINPVSYFYLSKVLAEKYIAIRKLNRRSKISTAPTIFDWHGERALIRPAFEARDTQRAVLNAGFELLAEADINAYFHSIYSHVIAWAIHGKDVAKNKRHDMGLYGNLIDLLVRNAQDGQTVGLPVGPDTSRLIAEIIGTSIDKGIQTSRNGGRQWKAHQRSALRFVDDFTIGCTSYQEAEVIIAAIRRSANEHELDLNNSKSRIVQTGPFFPAGWREHVRSLVPPADVDKSGLLRFFYGVEAAVRAHPEANVQKFSLHNARKTFLLTNEWKLVEDYLLSSYRENATVLPFVVEMLILRQLDKADVGIERIGSFVASRLPTLARLRKNGEICWLLFLCICIKAPFRASALAELFEIPDGCIAVLISDAKRIGIAQGTIDQSTWDRSLTHEGLRSPMWLYAYEGALKKISGTHSSAHISSDEYFGPLSRLGVEFYRSGSFHMKANQLLSKLRSERLRRKMQQDEIETNLAEWFDDFDVEGNESEDDEIDIY
jgi:hypothetical protein